MIKELTKRLNNKEFKLFMVILSNHVDNVYRLTDRLDDYHIGVSYIESTLKSLEELGYIKIIKAGDQLFTKLTDRSQEFADYLMAFKPQLVLSIETETKESTNGKVKGDDLRAICRFYAETKGVEPEKLSLWYQENYRKIVKSAKALLKYCDNDVERSKEAIKKANYYYKNKNWHWTLQGAMMSNIHIFAGKSTGQGEKKWDW